MTADDATLLILACAFLAGCLECLRWSAARDRVDRAARNSSALRYRREARPPT